jgi:hypothetical protein
LFLVKPALFEGFAQMATYGDFFFGSARAHAQGKPKVIRGFFEAAFLKRGFSGSYRFLSAPVAERFSARHLRPSIRGLL